MKHKIKFFCTIVLLCISIIGFAQESIADDDLYDLSLEELMKVQVTVASQKALTQRESPGILTVVTKEEIENSGARDLIDVLRLVPGIDFGMDVQGIVGITMRGVWGHEGKVLLMMDGQQLNELRYSTTQFGNHYPVDNIKRIEIIRGPGSAVYGGLAELGVINIITETGQDINGLKATVNYGQTDESLRGNLNLGIGKKINDFEFSLNGFIGNGNRSDRTCIGEYRAFDMTDTTSLKPTVINGKIKYKGLEAIAVFDQYKTNFNEYGAQYGVKEVSRDFKNLVGEIKYDVAVSDKLTITPSVSYTRSTPWQLVYTFISGETSGSEGVITLSKIKPGVAANFDLSEKTNLAAGLEYYSETGSYIKEDSANIFWNNRNSATISNLAFYAQAIIETKIANVTVGGRIENNSVYGTASAPRIGFTKSFGRFHSKLLFSKAFRSPGLGNIDLNASDNQGKKPDIEPERTKVVEFEAGYELTPDMIITSNIYYIDIDKPMFYILNTANDGYTYRNREQTGSKGVELEYRVRKNWGYINLNYAYYSSEGINKVPDYSIPDVKGSLLGAPQHKVSFNGNFKLIKKLSVNPTVTYFGKRYAYSSYDEVTYEPIFDEKDPLVLANLYFNYRDVFVKNLNVGIGCYNVFDSNHAFIQAYNGWARPMPGQGREFVLKLRYKL